MDGGSRVLGLIMGQGRERIMDGGQGEGMFNFIRSRDVYSSVTAWRLKSAESTLRYFTYAFALGLTTIDDHCRQFQ